MNRQSISFTQPNDEWLKSQVENKEYSSKSELINDLVRQARKQQRQIDWIKAKIEKLKAVDLHRIVKQKYCYNQSLY